ncbi:3'-5' exoribonuclease domain-containing protein [Vibrio alfacsensis]|uniref:3'-5' exoribonuclease domain-containing protein n=1 Tax=Vibrio alfacsensis TaxID=1074311 RepID=UPI004067BD23
MLTTLFLDTEFTELSRDAKLLSLALVDSSGRSFYAEIVQDEKHKRNTWLKKHVINNMLWLDDASFAPFPPFIDGQATQVYGDRQATTQALNEWLTAYKQVEIWADCPAYDWVLFCDLFGGALSLPKNINYMVMDFATALRLKGRDPHTPREKLVPDASKPNGVPHNALYDALLLKACYEHHIQQEIQ